MNDRKYVSNGWDSFNRNVVTAYNCAAVSMDSAIDSVTEYSNAIFASISTIDELKDDIKLLKKALFGDEFEKSIKKVKSFAPIKARPTQPPEAPALVDKAFNIANWPEPSLYSVPLIITELGTDILLESLIRTPEF